jgi:hypothetical protein
LYNLCLFFETSGQSTTFAEKRGMPNMNSKGRFVVGVLTALAMMVLTFALPRGGIIRDEAVAVFPMTVGVWAIFVLLFVKLK